jgi:hypothetical protein
MVSIVLTCSGSLCECRRSTSRRPSATGVALVAVAVSSSMRSGRDLVDEAPAPSLSRLEGAYDGVLGLVVVPGRVPLR